MNMEEYFDIVQNVLKEDRKIECNNCELREMIRSLKFYQESGQWLKDFQCDERGELPFELKRGVLSEDGLYNLMREIDMFYPREMDEIV